MSKIDESRLGLYLSNLMDDKLGHFRFWTVPQIADHVGPRNLATLDRFDEYRRKVVDACKNKLRQFTDEQILILVTNSLDDPEELGNEWHGWQREEIIKLKDLEPTWVQVGFGHPRYEADFTHWGMMDELSLQEALLLSVGLEPKHFDEQKIAFYLKTRDPRKFFPTIQFLLKRYEIFARKFPMGFEGHIRVSFQFLKDWFDEIDMSIHPSFREVLDRRCHSPILQEAVQSDVADRQPAKDLSSLERQTALKLIAAMACQGYKFDPTLSRNNATTDIQNDVAEIGHSLDAKTILKWLREATELVDKDYWKGSGD
jgi:hypothetical protein